MKTKTPSEADAVTVGDLVEFQDAPGGAPGLRYEALTLAVHGTPIGQPRGRWVGRRLVSTAQANAKRWKACIIRQAEAASAISRPWLTDGTALQVDTFYRFGTDKQDRWGKPHTNKPDKDNLDKLTLDALVKSGLIKDDSYVATGGAMKIWDKTSSLIIQISRAPENYLGSPIETPEWLKAAIERPTD